MSQEIESLINEFMPLVGSECIHYALELTKNNSDVHKPFTYCKTILQSWKDSNIHGVAAAKEYTHKHGYLRQR